MNNLVTCTRCNNVLMDEEYDSHLCEPKVKGKIKANFVSFYTYEIDNKIIIKILTSKGIRYQFEEILEDKEHTKIPYIPGSTDLRREEDSTSNETICDDRS